MATVSVGMPVYNGEPFLRDAVESMLAQTFGDFELVISDNASTDGTAEICRAYARQDRRIRYVRNATNTGAARNFNRVVELSTGAYFKLANADDLSGPELLAECVPVLDRHAEVVLCYARATLIDEHGGVIEEYDDGLDLRSPSAVERFVTAVRRLALVNILQGVTRSSVLRRILPTRSYPASDVILVERLALYGQFWEVPRRLFFRRMHARAGSSIRTVEERQEFLDPSIKGEIPLYLWRHQLERFASVVRAPLTPAEKLRLMWIGSRYAIGDRTSLLRELGQGLEVLRWPPGYRGRSGS